MISLIELEPNAKEPMYQQIYRALTSQIMGGTLKEGEYLPSKRVLCDTLNVSHSTVESAYALMLAEGVDISAHQRTIIGIEYHL